MSIRTKIILTVLPLLIAALVITGTISSFSARSGLSRIAMEFLGFKAQELEKYIENQWDLLVSNDLSENQEYVDVARAAVSSYAQTLVRSATELVFALDSDSKVVMSTKEVKLGIEESSNLYPYLKEAKSGWIEFIIDGKERVGHAFYFAPFKWYIFVSEEAENFYKEVTEIQMQTLYVLGGSLLVSVILLLIFSGYLTMPIRRMVGAMKDIISTNDLSKRVTVEFNDEIGELAHTFNIMTGELSKLHSQIKEFAFKAVLAQKNEHRIRNIFQKYVPKDVIEGIFENPESMLTGENRVVAILFSDIRGFTTISEQYQPDELVSVLNRYFEIMVDIIMNRGGVIDKYIGDAIMAFFGAPVKHDDDAQQAVIVALEMQEALARFNGELAANGKPQFLTGIGVNYGVVTVGNIGSDRKMDYTIIGDMVNLGSRLEGLSKPYKQGVIFSESVFRKVKTLIPCRMLDKVQVKGKTQGENIYTAKTNISENEQKGWDYHKAALKLYYGRNFKKAFQYFGAVRKLIPDDYIAGMYLDRCKNYLKTPPPKGWNGVEILTSK